AQAADVRDHGRSRVVGGAAVRRRDRRFRGASGLNLLHRLAELAASGERGVLFTVVEGDGVGGKVLVLESGERAGEGVPKDALGEVAPDHQTAIVVLTHDDKFDEPALMAALESEAFYIGALGSRRNQERRRERLLEAGVAEEAFERIMGPCGLDIGADTQEETALSILAEILAVRAQRSGGPLRDAKQRIHVETT